MSGQASFEVIVCPRLIGEISDVLDRPRLRKRIRAEDAREFVGTISALPNQVPDPSEIGIATRDADDDCLVALAREYEAVWIVTGDDDLLDWEEQQPRTIAPAAFEQWLLEQRARVRSPLYELPGLGRIGGQTWTQEHVTAGHGRRGRSSSRRQGEGRGFESRCGGDRGADQDHG